MVATDILTALPLYVYEFRFNCQPAEPSLGVMLCDALDLPVVAVELAPPNVSVLESPESKNAVRLDDGMKDACI